MTATERQRADTTEETRDANEQRAIRAEAEAERISKLRTNEILGLYKGKLSVQDPAQSNLIKELQKDLQVVTQERDELRRSRARDLRPGEVEYRQREAELIEQIDEGKRKFSAKNSALRNEQRFRRYAEHQFHSLKRQVGTRTQVDKALADARSQITSQ
jgi:hypothetical protein